MGLVDQCLDDLTIYIPTRGRTEDKDQVVWNDFSERLRKITYLVCPPDEEDVHRQAGRNVIPCPAEGIQPTRQWILDHAATDKIIMLDDDLKWYKRVRPDKPPLKRIKKSHIEKPIALMSLLLAQGYPHVGMSLRQGNDVLDGSRPGSDGAANVRPYTQMPPYRMFGRQCFTYGILVPAVRELGVKFRMRIMEDFDFCLQLLGKGYINPFVYSWCVGQQMSQKEGGCSIYRTVDLHTEVSLAMARHHPNSVTPIKKDNEHWGRGKSALNQRVDVRIRWAQEWMYAPAAHGNWLDPRFQLALEEKESNFALTTKGLMGSAVVVPSKRNKKFPRPTTIVYKSLTTGSVKRVPFSLEQWKRLSPTRNAASRRVSWMYTV